MNETNQAAWLLHCPPVPAGKLYPGCYNAGAGLAHDIADVTAEDSHMQVVGGVTAGHFGCYLQLLREAGFTLIQQTRMGSNRFAQVTDGAHLFHISFFAPLGQIRVVEDRVSVPVSDFSDPAPAAVKPAVYQYGLYYDPLNRDNTGVTMNCGMTYLLRLGDNRLFVIDGGHLYQSSDEAIAGLWDFMHRITGTPEDGTVTIAGWFITHAHNDHLTGMTKLLRRHHDRIDLQRVLFNFPSYQVVSRGYDEEVDLMKDTLTALYPNLQFLKPHTGEQFRLADVDFEVLYTHEDGILPQHLDRFPMRDYNCTSTVLRAEMEGQKLLFLADISTEAEAVISMIWSPEVWKSDLVQVAHHCFNFLNALYPWIQAPIALLPNTYFGAHTPENVLKLRTVQHQAREGGVYYGGEGTDGFQESDAKLIHIYHAPVVGGEYDGSGI